MKIKISGTEYDAAQLGKLSLFDIIELKRQTGLSVDELKESFADVDRDNPETAMRSEETLIGFGAVVWLARRKAGEHLRQDQKEHHATQRSGQPHPHSHGARADHQPSGQ